MPPTCYLHGLSAKRKHRNNSLDLMRTGEDPVGNEIVDGYAPTGNSRVEHRLPRVATIAECCRLQLGRDVLPHGVPLVSVDSPFSLFKVDRVGRQVPVDAHMAVAMEVKTFLTD